MNLKKLNEALDKLLMNEISDKTKRHVVDKRKANWLAAQATADNLKAKYDKVKDKVKMTKTEYKQVAKDLESQIGHLFDASPNVHFSSNEYIVEFTLYDNKYRNNREWLDEEGNINESAIEQLEKLLEKMTIEYGIRYYYEIDHDKVVIHCEKPENYEEPTSKLQDILDGTYTDKTPIIYYIYDHLGELSTDELVKIMNYNYGSSARWGLYPSSYKGGFKWDEADLEDADMSQACRDFGVLDYPVELARALVKSNACESLTDLYNVYYASTWLDDECWDVFEADIIDKIDRLKGNEWLDQFATLDAQPEDILEWAKGWCGKELYDALKRNVNKFKNN